MATGFMVGYISRRGAASRTGQAGPEDCTIGICGNEGTDVAERK